MQIEQTFFAITIIPQIIKSGKCNNRNAIDQRTKIGFTIHIDTKIYGFHIDIQYRAHS